MNYLDLIKQFVTNIREVRIPSDKKNKIKYQEFATLLAAPQALIKNADFYSTPVLSMQDAQPAPQELVRKNLAKTYHIESYNDAEKFLERLKNKGCAWRYNSFLADWKGNPPEFLANLSDKELEHYNKTKKFAENFHNIVGPYGFHGWDISMGVDLCREIHSAGYFSENAALEFIEGFASKATDIYKDWEQYAIGVICGGAFHEFSERSLSVEKADEFFMFLLQNVTALFTDKRFQVWNTNTFIVVRHYFKNLSEQAEFFPRGKFCIVSNEVCLDEKPIGFMFREDKKTDSRDTGWRMFSGEEDNDYITNPDNVAAIELNVLCNYDLKILPLLEIEAPCAFIKDENGNFVRQDYNG